ncbi:hypothetical protein [Wolbachia endosymbiont of Pentidionis agamae]|uniref:hypothetical protein n=1 Tax=Wolbachia endosymbiont of Pentidionis agamae TaxID=3110435 RepID=UPI002FD34CE0
MSNKFNIDSNTSFLEANKQGWAITNEGNFLVRAWKKTGNIADADSQYASHHKVKTSLTIVVSLFAVSLVAAYFLSPAYKGFVNAGVGKAAGFVVGLHGATAGALGNIIGAGVVSQVLAGVFMFIGAALTVAVVFGAIYGVKKGVQHFKKCELSASDAEEFNQLKNKCNELSTVKNEFTKALEGTDRKELTELKKAKVEAKVKLKGSSYKSEDLDVAYKEKKSNYLAKLKDYSDKGLIDLHLQLQKKVLRDEISTMLTGINYVQQANGTSIKF